MVFVQRDASDAQVLNIVRKWVDVLARQDYEAVFAALGYVLDYGEPGSECIRRAILEYRSPEHYPGIEEFAVTDWRSAEGGYPEPRQKVTWFKPNSTGLRGAVEFDLPLNGKWSDLRADFVFFDNKNLNEGYTLSLEEIYCWRQRQQEME